MAMAVAARRIGRPLTLFIPRSTLPLMLEKLKVGEHFFTFRLTMIIQAEKVDVNVIGNNWNEANAAAEETVRTREGVFMVHPFGQVGEDTNSSSVMNMSWQGQ